MALLAGRQVAVQPAAQQAVMPAVMLAAWPAVTVAMRLAVRVVVRLAGPLVEQLVGRTVAGLCLLRIVCWGTVAAVRGAQDVPAAGLLGEVSDDRSCPHTTDSISERGENNIGASCESQPSWRRCTIKARMRIVIAYTAKAAVIASPASNAKVFASVPV